MLNQQFIALKRLSRANHITVASRHNLREIQAERGFANRNLMGITNIILEGEDSSEKIKNIANKLMKNAGVLPLRKNACRCIELLISIPKDTQINLIDFFKDSLNWIKSFYRVPILSAVIHRDESTPHMHVLMLPLVENKMQGDQVAGDRTKIKTMRDSFFQNIGIKYGFTPPAHSEKKSLKQRMELGEMALNTLIDNPNFFEKKNIIDIFLKMIIRPTNLETLLEALNISPSILNKPARTLAEIMCRPVNPEPTISKRIFFNEVKT